MVRYPKDHKEASRRRILDVASKRFRSDGVAGVGLAGVMADAGLTNGAFYAHFDSKEALLRDALVAALDEQRRDLLGDKADYEAAIRRYLSVEHRDHPEAGCPSAAMVAEIARQSKITREPYTAKLRETIDLITKGMPGGKVVARRTAIAMFAMLIGILQLARAVNDDKLSREILDSGVKVALSLVKRQS